MHSLGDLPIGSEFHHVGYATQSIERERSVFESLGWRADGQPFTDPSQGVAGRFLVGNGPRIELLENLPNSTTLTPWIRAGVKMYHFAYLVEDINASVDWASKLRAKVTVRPTPAVAFNGRCISFVIFRNGLMLEFIEKSKS